MMLNPVFAEKRKQLHEFFSRLKLYLCHSQRYILRLMDMFEFLEFNIIKLEHPESMASKKKSTSLIDVFESMESLSFHTFFLSICCNISVCALNTSFRSVLHQAVNGMNPENRQRTSDIWLLMFQRIFFSSSTDYLTECFSRFNVFSPMIFLTIERFISNDYYVSAINL